MIVWLIAFPLLMAALAAAAPWQKWRPWILPAAGAGHLALTIRALIHPAGPWQTYLLALDPPGKLMLVVLSVLFFLCSLYSVGYLRYRSEKSNRIFCVCLLLFLSTMSLVVAANHLGLMWVAMEATTLSAGPLIYFNRTPRSLEATWKYLLICSVGIALALLGSLFMAYSAVVVGLHSSLLFHDLLRDAPLLSKPWLHAAFVLLLVGYGTKMGLAPVHTWKPDAYGEAPAIVGALLAGGLTNCAFLALLRVHHICRDAGETLYTGRLLIFIGLLSMAIAAVFLLGQRDFKRMLAYSSVEHMGIMAIGLGVGGAGILGALLHMFNNGLSEGVLFLSAGNIHRAYESKSVHEVHGAMRRLPLSGTLFMLGFFAITGFPPFGPFISEFTILSGTFLARQFLVAGGILLLLMVIFLGMGNTVLAVVQGRPSPAARRTKLRDEFFTSSPIVISMALLLLLGLHIPGPLANMLHDAARFLEVRP